MADSPLTFRSRLAQYLHLAGMDHERTANDPAAQAQRVDDAAASPGQPEHVHLLTSVSGESSGDTGRDIHTSSTERQPLNPAPSEGHVPLSPSHNNPYADFERIPPPRPARSRDGHVRLSSRHRTAASISGAPDGSGLDWIVPLDEKRSSHVSTMLVFCMC